jgi:hypothetical protein
MNVGPADKLELYVALEGDRGGLPVFCCPIRGLRLEGRPLPARLVLTPEEAGIRHVQTEWTVLRPAPKGPGWRRSRIPGSPSMWDLAVFQIQADSTTGIDPTLGTARYAVRLALRDARGEAVVLESDGARMREGWDDPQRAPGLRVTRHGGDSLHERALGLAGLPFREEATRLQAIARVALAPSDLFVVAYEDLSGGPFGVEPLPALDGPEWEWLFDRIATARRRAGSRAPFVGADGRAVAWRSVDDAATPGVAPGDVAVMGRWLALLEHDEGDGWLSNGDPALHGSSGRLLRGTLADLEGDLVTVLRPRDLGAVARDLTSAGYGPLPTEPMWTPRARRAMAEFQRDHGLTVSGKPDAPACEALRAFLARLDVPSQAADSGR